MRLQKYLLSHFDLDKIFNRKRKDEINCTSLYVFDAMKRNKIVKEIEEE